MLINMAAVCLLCGMVFLAFGQSLKYGFAWDDHGLIIENRSMTDGAPWYSVFFRHFWQIGQNDEDTTRSFYRPLISLSYSLDYAAWGLKPFGYHLTNLSLHAAASVAAYFLLLGITGTYWAALLTAVLWAIHPARVENVVWISGRTDLVCGLAYLIALVFLQQWMTGRLKSSRPAVLSVCAYSLALLSKETAITFIPLSVLLFILHPRGQRPDRRATAIFVGLLTGATALYFGLRAWILGSAIAPAVFGTWSQRLLSIPMVFSRYLGVNFGLLPVNPHHGELFLDSMFSVAFLTGALATLAFGGVALLLWRQRWKMEYFCLLWFPTVLIPVFYLGSFGDVLYADRFLYLPSLGLTACGTLLFLRMIRNESADRQRLFSAAAVLVAGVIMVAYSHAVSPHWKNSITLFRRISITSPHSAYVQFNLGNSLARIGAYEEACAAYQRALDLQPGYDQALTNHGAALNKLGRHQEVVSLLLPAWSKQALSDRLTLAALGDAFAGLENPQRAITFYRLALMQRSEPWLMQRLGICLMQAGQGQEAGKWLQDALEQNPGASSYHDWGLYLLTTGFHLESSHFFTKAQESLDREVPVPGLRIKILFHQAQALAAAGQIQTAIEQAENARRLQQESTVKPFPNGEIDLWINSQAESDGR